MSRVHTDSTGRLAWLLPSELSAEQKALSHDILTGPRKGGNLADENGRLRGPFNAMLHAPAVGSALQELGAAIRFNGTLTDRTREACCIVVAVRRSCEFELAAHSRIALTVGLSTEELKDLEQLTVPSTFSENEAAAVRLTLAALDHEPISDQQYQDFEAVLGSAACVELVTLAGYYTLLADLLAVFGVPG